MELYLVETTCAVMGILFVILLAIVAEEVAQGLCGCKRVRELILLSNAFWDQ